MLEYISNALAALREFYMNNGMSEQQAVQTIAVSLIIIGVILVGLYVLKAVAILIMAKKNGIKNRWMAFVPFLDFVVLGKLAGKVRVFGHTIGNLGIVYTILLFSSNVLSITQFIAALSFQQNPTEGTQIFYQITTYITSFVGYPLSLVQILCFVLLCFALYGRYTPERRMLFSFLSCFNFIFPIILFAIRNKKPYGSYDEYFKHKMADRYGQTYDPFSNPYETKENPFLNEKENEKSKNENPFDEF